jgi:uncharacterized protein YjiS (DUF1127 family)
MMDIRNIRWNDQWQWRISVASQAISTGFAVQTWRRHRPPSKEYHAMATAEFDISQLRSPLRERIIVAAATALTRIAGTWRAMRNRRAVAGLLDWDSHMLKDIGLTSGDVRSAMSGPLMVDPSYRLSVLSVERRAGLRAAARERLALARSPKVVPLHVLRREREKCLEI